MAQTPLTPVLAVADLCVRRGGVNLLRALSWTVAPGRHWAVLGPNGSGKTTLLKVLCGYEAPTSGSVRLLGKTYGRTDWNVLRKKIGLVSNSLSRAVEGHEPAEHVVLSGKFAMVNYWGRPAKADLKAAHGMMERTGCAGLAGRPWAVLSQGERQRLVIARALMGKPRVLFLDEPCAGLDPVAREAFLAFLQQLLKQEDTPATILITHHVEEIVPGISELLLLREGAKVAAGPLRDTLAPANLRRTFGSRVRLEKQGRRWAMKVVGKDSGLF